MANQTSTIADPGAEARALRQEVERLRAALAAERQLSAEQQERMRGREREFDWLMKNMASAFVEWETELGPDGELRDLRFCYFNDTYSRISGLQLNEVVGKTIREVWPGTEQSWYDIYGEVVRTGETRSFEMHHEPTRGLYSCTAYPSPRLTDRICVVFESILEHQQALSQLRELSSQQRVILNAISAGITYFRNRQLQWYNPAFERMLGYEGVDLAGRDARFLYANEEDYRRVGEEGYDQLEKGGVYCADIPLKKRDGSTVWTLLMGQAIEPAHPQEGSIWSMYDTTQRRQAEQALRESEERFRQLLKSSSDIIAVVDSQGRCTSINGPLERVLGYWPDELLGQELNGYIHPEDRDDALRDLLEVQERSGPPVRAEYRARHQNGTWVPLETISTNLLDNPAVSGLVINIRDISERKAAEEEQAKLQDQLQQAMKMEAIGRLAGGIAHDFNNLLTALTGDIELVKMDLDPADPLMPYLEDASQATASAADLTRQLLAFSRRQIIEPKVLNLNDLVDNLHKMLGRVIGEHISMQTKLHSDLGAVKVDPGQFDQVLVNLVVNARDAMPDGGTLVIETANAELDEHYCQIHSEIRPGPYVLLAVSDTGCGMDQATQQRIFEPFFTTKPKGGGTGLGLSTIFGTVKQAQGTIEVYSEIGQGSTFKVYLPRVDQAATKLIRASAPTHLPRGTETVLLVEDEDSVRELSRTVLSRLGYEVLSASNGGEALLLAEEQGRHIDLLMTDVVMPGLNGRTVADRLQALHPELKVLFTSGYTEDVIVHQGIVDEKTNFLSKPYSMQALATKLRTILEGEAP